MTTKTSTKIPEGVLFEKKMLQNLHETLKYQIIYREFEQGSVILLRSFRILRAVWLNEPRGKLVDIYLGGGLSNTALKLPQF